jgi:hypothetical protein
MSEPNLSTQAIETMREAGWDYYPCDQCFKNSYYQCDDPYQAAKDVTDFTGYSVKSQDLSVDKGYWYVSLANDDEYLDFAKRYNEYDKARQRIANALFNGVLLLTKVQYDKVAKMVDRYDKRFVGDWVMIAIPENEFTRQVIAILDALGM